MLGYGKAPSGRTGRCRPIRPRRSRPVASTWRPKVLTGAWSWSSSAVPVGAVLVVASGGSSTTPAVVTVVSLEAVVVALVVVGEVVPVVAVVSSSRRPLRRCRVARRIDRWRASGHPDDPAKHDQGGDEGPESDARPVGQPAFGPLEHLVDTDGRHLVDLTPKRFVHLHRSPPDLGRAWTAPLHVVLHGRGRDAEHRSATSRWSPLEAVLDRTTATRWWWVRTARRLR